MKFCTDEIWWIMICIIICVAVPSCKPSINREDLYGKWNYIKVSNPYSDAPDSVSKSELYAKSPFIDIGKTGNLTINWGDSVLSHGTYQFDGSNIQYKEILQDGKTRQFPFWIKKLTPHELVFETTGTNGTRVTAVK